MKRDRKLMQALANCNKALIEAKSLSNDADVDFHLSEAINSVNVAFDYAEGKLFCKTKP